jgi:hypothetical protein
MKNYYIESRSLNKIYTDDVRQAAFDQRKKDYLGNTNARPAVFIEPSKTPNNDVSPDKDTEI